MATRDNGAKVTIQFNSEAIEAAGTSIFSSSDKGGNFAFPQLLSGGDRNQFAIIILVIILFGILGVISLLVLLDSLIPLFAALFPFFLLFFFLGHLFSPPFLRLRWLR